MSCSLQDIDLCSLGSCIKEIIGLERNSNSKTDTWIVIFNENVEMNGKRVSKGFIKLFAYKKEKDVYALIYENKVYKQIAEIHSPFFVEYLGGADKCSYDDMLKFVGKYECEFFRNASFLSGMKYTREKITEPCDNYDREKFENNDNMSFLKQINFGFILVKPVPRDKDGLNTMGDIFDLGTQLDFTILTFLMFQVVAGCHTLSKNGINHNDLHVNNIFVSNVFEEDTEVRIEEISMTFKKGTTRVQIYDYDRSYSEKLGKSNKFDDDIIENKDVIRIFGELWLIYPDKALSWLCPEEHREFWEPVLKSPQNLKKGGYSLKANDYKTAYSTYQILQNIYKDLIRN